MPVAFDGKMSAGNQTTLHAVSGATSFSTSSHTVGASANLLVAVLHFQRGDVTGVALTWNSVSMTVGPAVQNGSGSGSNRTAIFYLLNPTTGSQTLAGSWTLNSDCYVSALSFTGCHATTPVVTGDNVTTSSGTTVTVTSDTAGATVAVWGTDGSSPTTNFTEIFTYAALNPGAAASYTLGGTSNGHTFTGAGGTRPAGAGIHIQAAAAAGQPAAKRLGGVPFAGSGCSRSIMQWCERAGDWMQEMRTGRRLAEQWARARC